MAQSEVLVRNRKGSMPSYFPMFDGELDELELELIECRDI